MCSRATWLCGLLTLDSAAVWSEGVLPRERHRATGLAQLPGTLSSGFSLKCNSQLTLISTQQSEELRQVCVCLCRRKIECYRASKCIYFLCVCVYTANTRQSHRSHCCDPVPGAGRQSRAPLTGGSTISHSSADGPVYSATQRDTARVSRRQKEKKKRSHTTINRHHVWLRRHRLASWQTVMLCRRTVYDSHRLMPKSTQRDQVN